MNGYRLRALERELSFVITPIDSFTGQYAGRGSVGAGIREPHKPPLVKREGQLVFFDLPKGEYEVNITSGIYFPEILTAETGGGSYQVVLIPNRRYTRSRGSTWIEGNLRPNATVYITPKGVTGFKLMSCEGCLITVMSLRPFDLTNRYIAVGEDRELCFVEERLDMYTYRLSAPLLKEHKKNTLIAPVSLGRTEKDGYLVCLLAGILPEQGEVLLWFEGEGENFQEIKITRGQGVRF